MNTDDLNVLKPNAVYELRPDRVYVVTCDGKHFTPGLVNALFRKVEEEGVRIQVIVTMYPKSMKIKEKEDGGSDGNSPLAGEGCTSL